MSACEGKPLVLSPDEAATMQADAATLVAGLLAWDMKKPCDDCPFRRDAPWHAGVAASLPEYIESIERNRFAHTCHKTDNRDGCDGPRNHEGPTQHCAGALLFVTKAGCDLQLPLLQAAEKGKLDLKGLAARAKRDKLIFASVDELVGHYFRLLEEEMRKRSIDPPVCCLGENDPTETTTVPLSQARAEGREIIRCAECGEPATKLDRLFPYQWEYNGCDAHGGNSLEPIASELEELSR